MEQLAVAPAAVSQRSFPAAQARVIGVTMFCYLFYYTWSPDLRVCHTRNRTRTGHREGHPRMDQRGNALELRDRAGGQWKSRR